MNTRRSNTKCNKTGHKMQTKCKRCGAFTTEGYCGGCWVKLLLKEQKAYGLLQKGESDEEAESEARGKGSNVVVRERRK